MVRKRKGASKPRSPALASVHETARGLLKAGFIDARRMKEFDILCLEPVEDFSAADVQRLRKELQISQAVLANLLNTSVSTVQKWESGAKRPSGPSLKLLNLLDRKGIEAVA